jgi:CHAT domain-containing protein/Tfp pilus assembly protein PilF
VALLTPFFLSYYSPRLLFAALVLLSCSSAFSTVEPSRPPRPTFLSPTQEKDTTVVRLEPGKAVEKTLAGGGSDSYEIQVMAGQFLHAVVDQLGIDVALTLSGPDGKRIATMDSPNGTLGPEEISTTANSSGSFQLKIVSGDENAAAGRYRVSVEPLRAPTDADRALISAERILVKAFEKASSQNADKRREAIQLYEESIPLWQAAGNSYEEALALTMAGEAARDLSDRQKALDLLNRAIPLWHTVGNQDGEAAARNDVGSVYASLGEGPKALDYFRDALILYRAAGDRPGEASALTNMGQFYRFLGQGQKALEVYNEALPLTLESGDRSGEAAILNNIGRVYETLGDRRKAIDYYEQALPLRRSLGDRTGEAVTLNNMGLAYNYLGEEQKALEYLNEALPLRRATGDRAGEARTLNNIGMAYDNLGQGEKAIDYYKQALPLYRAAGDRPGEGGTLNNIGLTYRTLGDEEKALDSFNQALLLRKATGDLPGEGNVLHNISLLYFDRGEKQKSLDALTEALQIERVTGNRASEGATLDLLGRLYKDLGSPQKALEAYAQGLPLSLASRDLKWESYLLADLMVYWRDTGKPGLAIFFGKQAVNTDQQLRANIRGLEKETQKSFLRSKEKTYRDLADLLITQGRLPEAQQVLDLLKNEEYFEFIRRDGNEASLTAPVNFTMSEEELNREYEENVGSVTAVGNEWAALHSKPLRTPEEEKHLADLTDQLKSANEAWEKFLSGLYAESGKPKAAQKTVEDVREGVSGMQRVLRQLGPGVVALYTLVGEEKYRVIIVTPNVMVAREYPIKAEDLRKKIFAFRQTLLDPKSDPVPQAQELYRILVGPAARDLAGAKAKTLMWSLDDVLRYIPMATLHDGHEYLVEKYQNEVFTPASLASLTERPNVNGWRGLGMGVSKSYGDFSALPSVPDELHGIIRDKSIPGSSGVLPGQMMLDETFTEDGMKKALEQNFPIVHIASHFSFAPGNDTNSFLLLGGKDRQGEHLSLAEIRTNPGFNFTDIELLTLSACNTAVSGAAGDGREIDGLGILAQQKGARAVVASLWGVYDPSTGILMQDFYDLWTTHPDMTKAEALREAQLELLHGKANDGVSGALYAHPFYWAPFILIGNSR